MALRQYRRALSQHLSAGCRVTGREDFPREEFCVFGPGEPQECGDLRRNRPSSRDEYVTVRLLADPNPREDLVAFMDRVRDPKRF